MLAPDSSFFKSFQKIFGFEFGSFYRVQGSFLEEIGKMAATLTYVESNICMYNRLLAKFQIAAHISAQVPREKKLSLAPKLFRLIAYSPHTLESNFASGAILFLKILHGNTSVKNQLRQCCQTMTEILALLLTLSAEGEELSNDSC